MSKGNAKHRKSQAMKSKGAKLASTNARSRKTGNEVQPAPKPAAKAQATTPKPATKRTRRDLSAWRQKVIDLLNKTPGKTLRPSEVGKVLGISIPSGAHTSPLGFDAWTLLLALKSKGIVERTEAGYHLLKTTATAKAR
jgi:hypothetical protein